MIVKVFNINRLIQDHAEGCGLMKHVSRDIWTEKRDPLSIASVADMTTTIQYYSSIDSDTSASQLIHEVSLNALMYLVLKRMVTPHALLDNFGKLTS